jgi:hypothetical protein
MFICTIVNLISQKTFNPDLPELGKPYDSTQGLTTNVQLFILIFGLAFILYIILKVRKSLKDEKRNRK